MHSTIANSLRAVQHSMFIRRRNGLQQAFCAWLNFRSDVKRISCADNVQQLLSDYTRIMQYSGQLLGDGSHAQCPGIAMHVHDGVT